MRLTILYTYSRSIIVNNRIISIWTFSNAIQCSWVGILIRILRTIRNTRLIMHVTIPSRRASSYTFISSRISPWRQRAFLNAFSRFRISIVILTVHLITVSNDDTNSTNWMAKLIRRGRALFNTRMRIVMGKKRIWAIRNTILSYIICISSKRSRI